MIEKLVDVLSSIRGFVVAAAIGCAAHAHPALSAPVPVWAVFNTENSDLPNDQVMTLAFGPDGSLWIGTELGLARLNKDGGWQTYSRESTNGGLPGNFVRGLAFDPDGSLWVGTYGGGVARLDKEGHWQTYSKASTNGGLSDDFVFTLARGPDGSLWAGTDGGGVARLDKDGHWQTYSPPIDGGSDNYIRALALGPDGSLWAGARGGLGQLDKDSHGETYSWESTNGALSGEDAMTLAFSPDGSLWAGTRDALARLDKDGHWKIYTGTNTNGGLPSNSVNALAFSPDGALWVGTFGGGLARLDKDGHWQTYRGANTNGGLPSNSVRALAFGPDGSLWVGTERGLARLDEDGRWQTYIQANTNGGLPDDSVSALAFGPDGSLWAGTGGGLARLDKDGHWQTYSFAGTNGGLPDNSVSALAFGPDGALWVGTFGGVARLDKEGHWQTYSQANTNGGLLSDGVYALALAPDGSLWVGTEDGVARFGKDGLWQTYTRARAGAYYDFEDLIHALALAPDGSLWVGTEGGIARLDKGSHWQTFSRASTDSGLPNDSVHALALAPDGSLWAGTERGLARLDKDGHWQTFSRASTDSGLPNDSVHALALAPDGSLWAGTGLGLARLDKDGHWQTYGEASTNGGLLSDKVSALAFGPDGSLWVGTAGGISLFDRRVEGTLRIIDVIGKDGEVTQAEQTFAVVAFDGSYLTLPDMFHYIWRTTEVGLLGDKAGPEIKTKSSVYRANFDHDGAYQLRVIAVDRYGNRSDPRDINFKVALPRPKSLWDTLASIWRAVLATAAALYALTLIALLLMTRRSGLAFRILTDAVWARWLTWPFFFLRHVPAVQRWILEPWFQAVRRSTPTDVVRFLDPPVSNAAGSRSGATALLKRLTNSPRIWLHGRSGMGKTSVFSAWERAYFTGEDVPNLDDAVRRYGFILIMLPLRNYASFPVPDTNRPESWVLEAVRRQLEQYGLATSDIGLIEAMLKAGHIALALDGTNEADRDLSLAALASQFPQTRLLVTSQALPRSLGIDERWEVWTLPDDIGQLRDGLLALWLGAEKGATLSRRIVAEGLSGAIVSGYDLRLLADLGCDRPEHAALPSDRVTLYRAMLARAAGPDGQPLRLEGLEQLAWTMMTQRRRRIVPEDLKVLGAGTLQALEREGLRIVRAIGPEHEFRHDQMRAFLAALWLIEETPTLPAVQKTATDAGAFALNRRDQEELWSFVAPLLTSAADLEGLWQFANDDPVERGILLAALQTEADKRGLTLVRVAQRRELMTGGASSR